MVLWLTPDSLDSSVCVMSRDFLILLMSDTGGNFTGVPDAILIRIFYATLVIYHEFIRIIQRLHYG